MVTIIFKMAVLNPRLQLQIQHDSFLMEFQVSKLCNMGIFVRRKMFGVQKCRPLYPRSWSKIPDGGSKFNMPAFFLMEFQVSKPCNMFIFSMGKMSGVSKWSIPNTQDGSRESKMVTVQQSLSLSNHAIWVYMVWKKIWSPKMATRISKIADSIRNGGSKFIMAAF